MRKRLLWLGSAILMVAFLFPLRFRPGWTARDIRLEYWRSLFLKRGMVQGYLPILQVCPLYWRT